MIRKRVIKATMDRTFKNRLEEFFTEDGEGLFWKSLDELQKHAGFKAHLRSLGRQEIVEPFELVSQWIAYNNVVCRRMSPEEFQDLTFDRTTTLSKPEPTWMRLQKAVQRIPMVIVNTASKTIHVPMATPNIGQLKQRLAAILRCKASQVRILRAGIVIQDNSLPLQDRETVSALL